MGPTTEPVVMVDAHECSYGLALHMATDTFAGLRLVRRVFEDLSEGTRTSVELQREPWVRLQRPGTAVFSVTAPRERRGILIKTGGATGQFRVTWRLPASDWDMVAELLDRMFDDPEKPGHQYLTEFMLVPEVVVVSYRE